MHYTNKTNNSLPSQAGESIIPFSKYCYVENDRGWILTGHFTAAKHKL